MRCLPITVTMVLCALVGSARGAGFSGGALPGKDILSLLPGEDGWEGADGQEWVRDAPPEPAEKKDDLPGAFALHAQAGGLLPFLAKVADYSGGPALGVGGRLRMGSRFPNWIRLTGDIGFISAEEDKWDGRSTLMLLHLDVGHNLLEERPLRLGIFLALGAGLEFFAGTELTGTGWESVSTTRLNLLAGGGATVDFILSERIDLGLVMRLTFPIGSRNVQGFLLFGVQGAYAF